MDLFLLYKIAIGLWLAGMVYPILFLIKNKAWGAVASGFVQNLGVASVFYFIYAAVKDLAEGEEFLYNAIITVARGHI